MSKQKLERLLREEFLPLTDQLFRFACSLVNNDEQTAEDLVQETWTKVIRSYESYQEGTNAKAWLFTILRNLFINQYRRKKRRGYEVELSDITVSENVDLSKPNDKTLHVDMDDDFFNRTFGDEITVAFESLSAEYQQIIALADLQEFKYDEIAEMLDLPIGTVRSRLFRARNALKKALKDYGDKHGYRDNR